VVTQLPVRVDLECTICMDKCDTLSMYHSPCGHPYCTDCLVDLVEASTRDESLHPLRCCKQHFVTEDVASRLTLNLRSRFYTKSIEFNTPPSSRIYCPKKTCSAFLGASGRSSNIICPTCKTGVCCQCKNAAHPGNACDEDTEVLQVKALARKELWQTCPGCYAIIELSQVKYISCGSE
jgi:hypothetical protein